jgi:hypothetical protein
MAEESGFGLDFLSQIINVQWEDEASAVFIAGGSEFVLYAKTSKDALDKTAIEKRKKDNDGDAKIFEDLGPLDFTGPTSGSGVFASSYRKLEKATFVTAGSFSVEDEATGTHGTGSVVMYSHDGKNWTQAFYKQWPDWIGNDSGVGHIAWDNREFNGHVLSDEYYFEGGEDLTPTNARTYERSLISSDGKGWTEGSYELRRDSAAVGGEPPPTNTSPPSIFMPHVNPESHLPDGKFGYYEKKDDDGVIVESYLVVPEQFDSQWYLSKFVFFSGPEGDNYGNSITITKLKDAHTTITTKTTPITYVTCVAYASEIVMAGGSSADFRAQIAASIDDGNTWEIIYQGPDENYQVINTITAAPLSDLKKDEDATA